MRKTFDGVPVYDLVEQASRPDANPAVRMAARVLLDNRGTDREISQEDLALILAFELSRLIRALEENIQNILANSTYPSSILLMSPENARQHLEDMIRKGGGSSG